MKKWTGKVQTFKTEADRNRWTAKRVERDAIDTLWTVLAVALGGTFGVLAFAEIVDAVVAFIVN